MSVTGCYMITANGAERGEIIIKPGGHEAFV